jgi:hypothetical protein
MATLGEIAGLEPRVLLLGDQGAAVRTTVTFEEIATRLRDRVLRDRTPVADPGEAIGWDIASVLSDPEALWLFNVEALYDICKAIQIDWVAALPSPRQRLRE